MAEAHQADQHAAADLAALRELKKAEADARDSVARAEADARKTAENAVAQARSVRDDAQEQARHAYEQTISQARRDAEGKAKDTVSKGKAAADALRAKAKGPSFEKAVGRVMDEFRKRSGA